MMKTERTAIMSVEPAIIVVVRAPASSIRPVVVWTVAHTTPNSTPVASYPSQTKYRKENRQHNKLLNHFYFPPFFGFIGARACLIHIRPLTIEIFSISSVISFKEILKCFEHNPWVILLSDRGSFSP
jgi:hypothetical protein